MSVVSYMQMAAASCSTDPPVVITVEQPKPSRNAAPREEVGLCSICVEPFNKSNHKPFESPCCPDFIVCRGCVGQFVMGSAQAPSCMTCRTTYGVDTLERGFTKKFMNEVHEEQAKLFVESQRSQLPATMPFVQRLGEADRMERDIKRVDEEMAVVIKEYHELKRARARMEAQISDARALREPRRPRPAVDANGEPIPEELRVEEESAKAFLAPCAHEGCRGFLSRKWRCEICEGYTCPRCYKPKAQMNDPDHTCDPNDVQSVEEIKKSTKPCPKCGTRITKLSGCSQMFCTAPTCGTVFDWNTMRIQTSGPEHNPLIHAWRERYGVQQRNGTEECGANITYWHISNARGRTTAEYRKQHHLDINALIEAARMKEHIADVEVRRMREQTNDWSYKVLRVRYLRNKIDEQEWARQIKSLHRGDRKRDDYLMVLGIVPEVLNDLIAVQLDNLNNGRPLDFSTIREFAVMTNESLTQINKKYQIRGHSLDLRRLVPPAYRA